jgi:arylsulfatase A-like enzyme
MDRRTFIQTLGACAAVPALNARAKENATRPPNVLFILPDQWRAQALGCMGNPDVHTPNIDRLASEGLLFRHTLANTPVCCPARANILTGTYASRNGMVANDLRLRESKATIANLFSQAGYRTGFIGKWHLDGGPRVPGFVPPGPRRHGFQFWAANECWTNYFYGWYFRDENTPIIMTEYEPQAWTDIALEFLRKHRDQDKPFFLILAPHTPHDPYMAPERFLKMYDPQALSMRRNWVEGTQGGARKDIAGYYASITAIDEQVGRLMKELRELGMEENTIVVFTSDHGNMLGSQGAILKRKPWEESIGVPGIIRYPAKVSAGRKSSALISHVDLGPTLLSLCQIPIPANIQGADLSEVVLGTKEAGPDSAYFQIFGPYHGDETPFAWRGVRTDRYMYARSESGPWLLYNLDNDPYELRNLVTDSSASAIRKEMDERLTGWMTRAGDSRQQDWVEPVEDGGRLYSYRTFYTVDEYLKWAKLNPNLDPDAWPSQ